MGMVNSYRTCMVSAPDSWDRMASPNFNPHLQQMKRIAILSAVLLFPSCEGVPVNVAYTGAAAGHSYTAAYSTTGGAALVVNQK